MSVIGAFAVPHPPIIMPEVGRGEERKIQKTADAYREAMRRAAALKPDRVVPVPGVTWTEERFMAVLEEKAGAEAEDVARDLLAWGRRATSEISYGRGVRDGALIPMLQWRGLDYYPIFVWTYGKGGDPVPVAPVSSPVR